MENRSGLIVITGSAPRGIELPKEPCIIGMQVEVAPDFDYSNVVFLRRPPQLRLIRGGQPATE